MNSGESAVPATTSVRCCRRRARSGGRRVRGRCASARSLRLRPASRGCRRTAPYGSSRRRPHDGGDSGSCAAGAAVEADQLADDRIGHARDLDAHDPLERRLHVGDAGSRRAVASASAIRRALDSRRRRRRSGRRRSRRSLVERASTADRLVRTRHAAGDDERDRQRLAPHQAQVAQELAVENRQRLHQEISDGLSLWRVARCAGSSRRRGRRPGPPCRRSRRCA